MNAEIWPFANQLRTPPVYVAIHRTHHLESRRSIKIEVSEGGSPDLQHSVHSAGGEVTVGEPQC